MSGLERLDDPRVLRAVELVWREATLLDDKDYEAWADLWSSDGMYIIPIDHDAQDHASRLNMVYDDERMRRMRVERMVQGYSPSAVAAARTARTVSRFTVTAVSDAEVSMRASQLIVAFKRGRHDIHAADVEYRVVLGASAADDRMGEKVVRLINSEDAVSAAGFLL